MFLEIEKEYINTDKKPIHTEEKFLRYANDMLVSRGKKSIYINKIYKIKEEKKYFFDGKIITATQIIDINLAELDYEFIKNNIQDASFSKELKLKIEDTIKKIDK